METQHLKDATQWERTIWFSEAILNQSKDFCHSNVNKGQLQPWNFRTSVLLQYCKHMMKPLILVFSTQLIAIRGCVTPWHYHSRLPDPHLDVEMRRIGEVADKRQAAQAEQENVQAEERNHVARAALQNTKSHSEMIVSAA